MDDSNRLQLQLELWKKTVDVQQHFNDIEMRIRALALTVLSAVLGGSIAAARFEISIQLGPWSLQVASLVLILGVFAWLAFYFVDGIWYHRLLMGAVRHGEELENLLGEYLPGAALTQRISAESPYTWSIFGWNVFVIHSRHKLKAFYWSIALLLAVLAVLFQVGAAEDPEPDNGDATGHAVANVPPPGASWP